MWGICVLVGGAGKGGVRPRKVGPTVRSLSDRSPRENRRQSTSGALVHGWQNAVMMDRDPFLPLRKLKHLGFLNVRRIDRAKVGLPNRVYEKIDPRVPYRFDIERHRNRVRELPRMYFLHRDPPAETTDVTAYRDAPHTLFLLRTGENEITPNRQAGIDSDYLRAYLLRHHGGAYADDLAEHPGDAFGRTPGYPINWIEIGMDVLYPLELEHLDHVLYDDSIRADVEGHR